MNAAGDRYRDLGGGVFDDSEPAPPRSMSDAMRAPDQMPSCPQCGQHEMVDLIESPLGRYFCGGSAEGSVGCGTLFDGTDAEWRRWRTTREEAARRRDQAAAGNRETEE